MIRIIICHCLKFRIPFIGDAAACLLGNGNIIWEFIPSINPIVVIQRSGCIPLEYSNEVCMGSVRSGSVWEKFILMFLES